MQQHQSILGYRHGRYLKLAILVCVASIAGYVWFEPPTYYLKPYGGTAAGYTLGTIAAVLILWLMLLGVRKRRYRTSIGSVHGWTSAHVYLGTSLIVIATLHCAFEFGWNIHTLTYALMMAVIVSGFFGIGFYHYYPELIAKNLSGDSFEALLLTLADLDRKCRRLALDLPDEVNAIVVKVARATTRDVANAGHLSLQSMPARDQNALALSALRKIAPKVTGPQAKVMQQLIAEMTRKRVITDRVRRDLRFRTMLQVWLYFHVPLSFALLAALIAHVISVFYFW